MEQLEHKSGDSHNSFPACCRASWFNVAMIPSCDHVSTRIIDLGEDLPWSSVIAGVAPAMEAPYGGDSIHGDCVDSILRASLVCVLVVVLCLATQLLARISALQLYLESVPILCALHITIVTINFTAACYARSPCFTTCASLLSSYAATTTLLMSHCCSQQVSS